MYENVALIRAFIYNAVILPAPSAHYANPNEVPIAPSDSPYAAGLFVDVSSLRANPVRMCYFACMIFDDTIH